MFLLLKIPMTNLRKSPKKFKDNKRKLLERMWVIKLKNLEEMILKRNTNNIIRLEVVKENLIDNLVLEEKLLETEKKVDLVKVMKLKETLSIMLKVLLKKFRKKIKSKKKLQS